MCLRTFFLPEGPLGPYGASGVCVWGGHSPPTLAHSRPPKPPPWPQAEFDQKSRRYRREVIQKVKKTSRESVGREREHRKLQLILPIWNSRRCPGILHRQARKWWHGLQLGTSLTRAGGQDDVSSYTSIRLLYRHQTIMRSPA